MHKTKRPLSFLLAVLMIVSMFAAAPFTASAEDKVIGEGVIYKLGDTIVLPGDGTYYVETGWFGKQDVEGNGTVTEFEGDETIYMLGIDEWGITTVFEMEDYQEELNQGLSVLGITFTGSGTETDPYVPKPALGVFESTWAGEGEGTEDSPWLINDVEDLRTLSANVKSGMKYTGKYLKLMADIDCGSGNWEPIGQGATFGGTFDGNGNTITYHITNSTVEANGLFSEIAANGTVKNLSVSGSIFSSANFNGGIAGKNGGSIINCLSAVDITTSKTHSGGIAGSNWLEPSKTSYCVSTGTLTWTGGSNAYAYIGGITGENRWGAIDHCAMLGDVLAQNTTESWAYAGIVIGRADMGTATDCYYLNTAETAGAVNSDSVTAKTADELKPIGQAAIEEGYTVYGLALGGSLSNPDQEAADAVIALIDAIGTVEYTPESKALIDAARAKYNELTTEQQALVTNAATLTAAETAYAELETEANTVRIGSVDDWNSFADSVKNGNTYSGKTVLLTADVGTVTTMVEGTFSGTFDGDGHMLTVDITGGTVATFQNAANAVFQNFTLAGSVTGSGIHTGALVKSITGGTCSFKNVIVSANVNGAKGYVGGFVAHAGNGFTVSFKNCLYSGSINHTGTQGNFIGAFIGWSQNCTATIENCAFTGSYSNIKSFNNIGFSYNAPRSVTVSDFYSNASEVFVANVNRGTRLYTPGSYTSVEGLVINGDEWTFFAQYSDALSAAQSGGTLLMLDKAVTDAETLIDAIGTVEYTPESKVKIDEARAAYDALTDTQKDLVDNYTTLTAAEARYAELKAEAEAAAELAQAKTDAKDALDNYVNADDYRAAEQADLADAIAAGKTTIDNAESIDDVNTALAAAKTAIDAIKTDAELTAEEDQAAANAAMDKINAIGTVAFTYESKAKIDAAREAYDDLTDAQQALVTNYKTLTDAEEAYVALEAAAPLAITLSTDDNVLFTSVAVGGKPSDIVFNDQNKPVMSPVGKIPGSDRKQTVLDESRSNFYADCRGLKDGICRIGYSKAKSTENDVISGMIVDADGNVKYYGVLGYANPAPLTVFPFDVSGQYEVGDRIYIFNEYLNGDNMTDYSSALIDVTPEKLPEGLTATAGQTLADVAIPNPEGNTDGTWTWDDTSIPVDTVGEYTFAATFTPGDTSKFDIVHTNLTVTVTDPDQEAADAVIALINAIGTVENTAASKEKIDAARTAYDALTDAQKALVSNDETLTAAEARYAELKAAEELAAAKRTAKSALLSYKDTHDYRAEQKAELSNAIDDGIAAINAATNTDEVAAALEAAKAVMDAIKTDAQLTAEEELAAAKADAKAELDSYKNAADYRPAQQTELTNAINAGNAAIDAATSTDGVATALENAKAAIDAIKTDAELIAEEEAAALVEKAQDWVSVRIDDQICINFLLAQRDDFESVKIEYIDQDLQTAAKTIVYADLSELTIRDGHYLVPVVIAPAQIGDTIKATLTVGGQEIEYTMSVKDYCEYLIANYEGENAQAVIALAKATLEYGQAANDYFAYSTTTINSPYTAEEKAQFLADAKGAANTLSTTGDIRSKLASAAFMALTQPEFRFYFNENLTEAKAVELNDNNQITTNVEGVTARFYKNGDGILLEVKGIEAKDMDKVITITVGDLGTITFSGNDFARMMANSSDQNIAALGAALYLYGTAAKACFTPNQEG